MEQAIISGIAHDRSEAKITVVGVPDKIGEAARIFQAVAEAEINIDMIVQNVSAVATGLTDISFTLPKTDGQTAIKTLERIKASVGFESLQYDDQIGKVSVVGVGMRSHPGVSAAFFTALADGRGQPGDDLDVRDPNLGGGASRTTSMLLCGPRTRRSAWTTPTARPSSTEGPDADWLTCSSRQTSPPWPSSARPAPSARSCCRSFPPARTSGARSG